MKLIQRAWAALLSLAVMVQVPAAQARTHLVPARAGAAAGVLAMTAPGDTVTLAAGIHPGPLRIIRGPVVLRGLPGAIVDGGGHGSVIEIAASGTIVEDLEVRRSGARVIISDAGVRIVSAQRVRLERLQIHDVLYGVVAERADSLVVRDGDLRGRVRPLDETGEGNGIHLWSCSSVLLGGNRVSHFLDAIYLSFAHRVRVEGQRLEENGRYGLHTMYCQNNQLLGNRFTHNVAGVAIMFSNHLVVERNWLIHNRGSRTYGLLLRDCSDGVFRDNVLADNTIAVFLDGSNRNRFNANLFQDNGWGVLLFSSSADNVWSGNDFIQNDYPVALDMRRTRNRFDDGEHGNYWSEARTYDLDGDGRSDVPHSPVTAFAFVSKQYPDLAVLAKSPAVAALGVAERVFPSLRPSEALDRFPTLRPNRHRSAIPLGADQRPHAAWGYGAAFTLLGMMGLWGMRAGRRP